MSWWFSVLSVGVLSIDFPAFVVVLFFTSSLLWSIKTSIIIRWAKLFSAIVPLCYCDHSSINYWCRGDSPFSDSASSVGVLSIHDMPLVLEYHQSHDREYWITHCPPRKPSFFSHKTLISFPLFQIDSISITSILLLVQIPMVWSIAFELL